MREFPGFFWHPQESLIQHLVIGVAALPDSSALRVAPGVHVCSVLDVFQEPDGVRRVISKLRELAVLLSILEHSD